MSEMETLLSKEFEKLEKILQKQNETISKLSSKIDQLVSENEELRRQLLETRKDIQEVKKENQENRKELEEFYKQIAEEMLIGMAKYVKSKMDKTDEKFEKTLDEKIKKIAEEVTDEKSFEWLKNYIESMLEEAGKQIVRTLSGNQVGIKEGMKNLYGHGVNWHKNEVEWLDAIYKELKEVKNEVKSIRDPNWIMRDSSGHLSVENAFKNLDL
jgi:chromosome segregation ATPase